MLPASEIVFILPVTLFPNGNTPTTRRGPLERFDYQRPGSTPGEHRNLLESRCRVHQVRLTISRRDATNPSGVWGSTMTTIMELATTRQRMVDIGENSSGRQDGRRARRGRGQAGGHRRGGLGLRPDGYEILKTTASPRADRRFALQFKAQDEALKKSDRLLQLFRPAPNGSKEGRFDKARVDPNTAQGTGRRLPAHGA